MKKDQAVIWAQIAELYAEANDKSEYVDEVFHGMVVKILGEQKDFYEIETEYKYTGFVHKSNLNFDCNIITHYLDEALCIRKVSFGDIMSRPDIKSSRITTLACGSLVRMIESESASDDEYVKVMLADGKTGYINKHSLKLSKKWGDLANIHPETENYLRTRIIKTAKMYENVQYRWGGKSHLGIDCSGLAFMAYFLNGIIIWRDAEIKKGFRVKEIAFEKAKFGDLVYFPGHVAMLLENGRIIHSSKSNNGVKIESLNKNHSDFRRDLYDDMIYTGSLF